MGKVSGTDSSDWSVSLLGLGTRSRLWDNRTVGGRYGGRPWFEGGERMRGVDSVLVKSSSDINADPTK